MRNVLNGDFFNAAQHQWRRQIVSEVCINGMSFGCVPLVGGRLHYIIGVARQM